LDVFDLPTGRHLESQVYNPHEQRKSPEKTPGQEDMFRLSSRNTLYFVVAPESQKETVLLSIIDAEHPVRMVESAPLLGGHLDAILRQVPARGLCPQTSTFELVPMVAPRRRPAGRRPRAGRSDWRQVRGPKALPLLSQQ